MTHHFGCRVILGISVLIYLNILSNIQASVYLGHIGQRESEDGFPVALSRGARQAPDHECLAVDIIFALDSSTSVREANWQYVLNFAADIVRFVGVGPEQTRVGVISFSDKIKVVLHLANQSWANETLADLDWSPFLTGGTNTTAALGTARDMFRMEKRPEAPGFFVIVTDGGTIADDETRRLAADIRAEDVTIIAVVVGDKNETDEMRDLVSVNELGESYLYTTSAYTELFNITDKLHNDICLPIPTTPPPTTEPPSTEAPSTEATTTEAPTTEAPTTEAPTTEAPTTIAPPTPPPTTTPEDLDYGCQKEVEPTRCYTDPCSLKCKYGFASDKYGCVVCCCKKKPSNCP